MRRTNVAAVVARERPREQRRARGAEVQEAGRRRRDAGAHRAGLAQGIGARGGSQRSEAARQVGLDVLDVVEPDRDADHPLGDAGRQALLFA